MSEAKTTLPDFLRMESVEGCSRQTVFKMSSLNPTPEAILSEINKNLVGASDSIATNDASTSNEEEMVKKRVSDFTIVVNTTSLVLTDSTTSTTTTTTLHPLYLETATQLGLQSNPSIPSLISAALPRQKNQITKRFLRRWLLLPPPSHVSDAMASILNALMTDLKPLPPLCVPPVGKVMSLIKAEQAR